MRAGGAFRGDGWVIPGERTEAAHSEGMGGSCPVNARRRCIRRGWVAHLPVNEPWRAVEAPALDSNRSNSRAMSIATVAVRVIPGSADQDRAAYKSRDDMASVVLADG